MTNIVNEKALARKHRARADKGRVAKRDREHRRISHQNFMEWLEQSDIVGVVVKIWRRATEKAHRSGLLDMHSLGCVVDNLAVTDPRQVERIAIHEPRHKISRSCIHAQVPSVKCAD